jgi:hypothetical protein
MNAQRSGRGKGLRVVQPGERSVSSPGQLPGKQLRCRSGHHKFALDDWEPETEQIPRTVTVMPATEGRLKLMDPCTACWAVTAVTYTHPGGVFDPWLARQLVYGAEWVRMTQGEPRGRRVMRAEKYERGAKQIAELLTRVTALDEDVPPPAVFQPPVVRAVNPARVGGA